MPEARPIRVGAAQLPANPLDQAACALRAVLDSIDQAAARGVELLVLPECAYPAYALPSVAAYRAAPLLPNDALLRTLASRAQRHRLHLVCGFVEDHGDRLANAAVLIDDRGHVLGIHRKTFLWGDDHKVFTPGDDIRVFDTRLGKVGIAICADVRVPEVTAALAVRGAAIVAVPTCWVNLPKAAGEFYNPQPDFLIEARARELAVPFVCANKFGQETREVGYCGFSLIVDADANVVAKAPPDQPMLVTASIVPGCGRALAIPDWTLHRVCSRSPPENPSLGGDGQVVLAAVPTRLLLSEAAQADDLIGSLARRGVKVVASSLEPIPNSEESPASARAALAKGGGGDTVVPSTDRTRRLLTIADSLGVRIIGHFAPHRVLMDEFASHGVIRGQDAVSFAPTRALALDGAALVFVTSAPDDIRLLRARAMENRVYVVATADETAAIVGPDGTVLDRTEPPHPGPLVRTLDLTATRDKFAFRDTHIFDQRRPAVYASIFR